MSELKEVAEQVVTVGPVSRAKEAASSVRGRTVQ